MTESIFAATSSCYGGCGLEETFFDSSNQPKMQRPASHSRRNDHSTQPHLRCRSEERTRNADESLRESENEQAHDKQERKALQKSSTAHKEVDEDDFHDALAEEAADKKSPNDRIHRRAMSDPFDTPLSDENMAQLSHLDAEAEAAELSMNTEGKGYPTLPRYPMAATRNKNCWSEPPVSIYSVRGPKYLSNSKKVPSGNYLLPAIGCDLFLVEDESLDVGCRTNRILNGHLRSLPTFSINFRFPWGSMIMYWEVPSKLAKYIGLNKKSSMVPIDEPDFSPAEKVLANYLQGDEEYKNERLKLIPYVAEGPWVVRNMVTGRPAIIGKKLPVSYKTFPAEPGLAPLCQCTLDIGSSSATAKRIVSVCRRYMSALTVDIGFVIQGETADELPEQMLGSIRIHYPDPLKAPQL